MPNQKKQNICIIINIPQTYKKNLIIIETIENKRFLTNKAKFIYFFSHNKKKKKLILFLLFYFYLYHMSSTTTKSIYFFF